MKRVHLVTNGKEYMLNLAKALMRKEYIISCSGLTSDVSLFSELQAGELSQFVDKGQEKIDCVVAPMLDENQSLELQLAQELGMLVLSFPEFILRMTKNKTRIVVYDTENNNQLFSLILSVLKRQKNICDYVSFRSIDDDHEAMSLSYNARIVLLEASANNAFYYDNIPLHLHCNPHILVVSCLNEDPKSELSFLSDDTSMLIERDGKLIYNKSDENLTEWTARLREDVTAISTEMHPIETDGEHSFLVTRYGLFPVKSVDDKFLLNINLAKYTCRQLGVSDKDFYIAVSELTK